MGKKKGNKDKGKAEGSGDGKDKQEEKKTAQSAVPGPGGDTAKKHDRSIASGSSNVTESGKSDILPLDFPSLSINPQKKKGQQKQQQQQHQQQQQQQQQQPQKQQQKQKQQQPKQPQTQGAWEQQPEQSKQQPDKYKGQQDQKQREQQRQQQQQVQGTWGQEKQPSQSQNVWEQNKSSQKPQQQQPQQQQMQGAWGRQPEQSKQQPDKYRGQQDKKQREQYNKQEPQQRVQQHQQQPKQQQMQGEWGRQPEQAKQQSDKYRGQQDQKQKEQYDKQEPQQKQQQQQQQRQQQQPQFSERKDSVSSSKSTMSTASISPSKSVQQFKRTDINLDRGTKGRKIKLEVNYLKLIIQNMIDTAYHYDIKFDPDKPKRFLRVAFVEYCRNVGIPNNIKLAFDGKCNVYSPIELDNKYLKCVELKAQDQYGSKDFKVTMMKTGNTMIDLKCLKEDYRNLPIYDKPQRALQCLDVVLRSPCYDKGVLAGRAFYNPPARRIDLTEGYELWYGLFLAAVLGEVPLLNIDICHRSFASGMPVLDILKHFGNPRRNETIDYNYELNYKFKAKLDSVLRGLMVNYQPPKCFNATGSKRYRVNQVMGSSDSETFINENKQKMTVAAYYASRSYHLRYPKMPCIWVGSRDKNIYLPCELLQLEAGQTTLKKAGVNQVRYMIKDAATTTTERKEKTLREFRRFNHNNDPIVNSFRIKIDSDFIQLEGRVIDAPVLNYKNGNCTPREGSWDPFRNSNLMFLKQPVKPFLQSAVLNLDNYVHDRDAKNFGDSLKREGAKIGVYLDFKTCLKAEQRDLDKHFPKFKQEGMDIIFVILSGYYQDSYSKVKQLAETKYGLLTQCIKADTVNNKNNVSTLQNILLKVNAKLNGSSHVIDKRNSTNILNSKDVMFIGADVTHPSPEQRSIPSVVGVCASHDLDGVEYNIQWRLQDPKKEIIQNMSDILEAHLRIFQKRTKTLPKKIIYYRDGVSDGQFPQIKDEELRAMDQACCKFRENSGPYRPNITCIIVQKRHRTRFFPKPEFAVGKFKNVPPGTIVDTVITHPNECQFFMVSHQSIQGTAKPTKYVVIRDDAKFNIDDLQALTNNLCHLFTRCNRAVSYPAPAYYAHLVAYRGRVYIENMKINLSNLEREYQVRKIKGLDESNPMFFV